MKIRLSRRLRGAPRAVGGVGASRTGAGAGAGAKRASVRLSELRLPGLLRNRPGAASHQCLRPRRVRGEVVRPVLLRPLERRRAGRRRHVRRLRRCLADHLQVHCRRRRRGGLGRRRPPVGGARGQQRQGAAPRGRRAERGGARRLGRAGRVGGAPVVRRHDDAVRHAGRVRQHRVDRRRLVLLAVHAGRVRLHVAAEGARRRRDGQRRAHDAPAGGRPRRVA